MGSNRPAPAPAPGCASSARWLPRDCRADGFVPRAAEVEMATLCWRFASARGGSWAVAVDVGHDRVELARRPFGGGELFARRRPSIASTRLLDMRVFIWMRYSFRT